MLHSLLAVVDLQSSKIYVDFSVYVHSSIQLIALGVILDSLVSRHVNEVSGSVRILLVLLEACWNPVGRRWHDVREKLLVGVLGLGSGFPLIIDLFLHKRKELVGWHISELAIVVLHEPLEDILIGILFALLVGNIVAVGGLFVELGERVGCLFETIFQTIHLAIDAMTHLLLLLLGLERLGIALVISGERVLGRRLVLGTLGEVS